MPFKVSKFPKVKVQIQALLKRAMAQELLPFCLHAFKRIEEHLENRPLQWGDPENNTQHPGGLYCHGIEWHLLVRYTVYEAEQTVIIYDIIPLPSSPLAGP